MIIPTRVAINKIVSFLEDELEFKIEDFLNDYEYVFNDTFYNIEMKCRKYLKDEDYEGMLEYLKEEQLEWDIFYNSDTQNITLDGLYGTYFVQEETTYKGQTILHLRHEYGFDWELIPHFWTTTSFERIPELDNLTIFDIMEREKNVQVK